MEDAIRMRPLAQWQYEKTSFRAAQRALSYPEKVRQVVAMQERIAPILAARGRIIKPWRLDLEEMACSSKGAHEKSNGKQY